MSDQSTATTRATPAPHAHIPRLSWPPPGLEPMQGEIWSVITEFTLGSLILAVPLLVAIATQQRFASLGPFGHSWWVPMATSVLAFIVLGIAAGRLSRVLKACAAASRLGYGAGTIATVLTDSAKDSGFLLQGARVFSTMPSEERRTLVMVRITSALCYLFAAMWIPLGLTLAVVLAAAGTFGASEVWLVTLAPAFALILAAITGRTGERVIIKRARRRNADIVAADVEREAGDWNNNLALAADEATVGSRRIIKPRTFAIAAFAVVVPAVLLLIPIGAVFTSAAMGPVLATIAVPRYGKTQAKAAVADALRVYRLPGDPAITPEAGGAAMYNLVSLGREPEKDPMMRAPAVHYPAWPAPPKGWDLLSLAASGKLFAAMKDGSLTAEQRAYVALIAAHPSHVEYATVAHATHADILGARFNLPLPDTLSAYMVPILRFGRFRESAYMHIAKAAQEFSEGRNADAERTLKETMSAGFLLYDESTSLIENLIAHIFITTGAKSLEEFYRETGRPADADALAARRDGAERAANIATAFNSSLSDAAVVAEIPSVVSSPEAMRGLRWEYFTMMSSLAPCINLRNVVFGPGLEYDTWVNETRKSLVRYPAEAELFRVARAGFLGTKGKPATRCVPSNGLKILKDEIGGL